MKKKVFSLMMTLLLAFMGVAKADVVTIGDGTGTTYYAPYNSLWGYSFVEQVYTADEIGTAGTINSISFNMQSTDAQTNAIDVFMKNVSRSNFSGSTDWESVTASDMVFSGTVTFQNGWTTITLDTPFQYDGTSNLMIGIHEKTSGYSTRYFYYTAVTGGMISGHSDSADPNPYDMGSYSGSTYTQNYRANIQIDITPGGGGGGQAATLLVHDGTATNAYVPIYGLYGDAYLKCEMVYPAAELSAMNGGTINAMTFYTTSPASEAWTSTWQVFVSEVADASISDFYGPGTVVYEGALDGTGAEMTINFTTPYQYNGGNLLVGVYNIATGNYKTVTWAGETVDGASVQGYNYSSLSGISATQRNFLPKTTFDYTTAGGGAVTGDQLFALQDGVEVDTIKVGPRPDGAWMEPFTFQLRNDGPATTVSLIDFTPSEYFTVVNEMPFDMANGEELDINLMTGDANGNDAWQMVAIYGEGRTARVWDITVEPYTPGVPDVVETAYDLGTLSANFSYQGVPSEIEPTELHDNYTLPFPEIEDGEDAVYKFTVESDMIINAWVDTLAENGKVALYTEDFYGEGGPMATNNYQGLDLTGAGGGATGGSFEAMIGDETSTSTSTYFPFHTLWNYSLAENLFLATELTEAGVTTAPMTSLSWYVSSTTCTTAQNSISIWMGNVSDSELTATSHTTAGMTLVYTGDNVLPVAGQWNEFEFNAGSFAWDGQSNILVLCQRNNGSWQGSVSWQTHNPGFAGTCYSYTDNAPGYDATTSTYSMSTSSTNRANIIFKGGNRNREDMTFSFEGGMQGWTSIDNDNDGNVWFNSSESMTYACYEYTGYGHNASDGFAVSQSYTDCTSDSYDADNYLVSPQKYTLGTGASLNFFFDYANDSYPDYFEVCVATANNPTANDFTTVWNVNMRSNAAKTQIRHINNRYENWREVTVDLSAYAGQEVWIAFHHQDYDNYEIWIDDVTINTGAATPAPTPGTLANVSAGPVIENLGLRAGTYYLVASATQADYDVFINVDNMPCPAVDGFAFNPQPADNDDGIEPASVTLRWMNPQYATGWRLIFGSTYYPDPEHPQTIMYPEDGSFTTEMATSYTVRNLWNNTNYFWRVEFNNDACPDGMSSPIWGFTTHLNIPTNLTAVDYTVFNDEEIVLNWNAVVDRTYRQYYIYRDGVQIGETTMNNISNTTYTDGPLPYNMGGYTYYVTAIYDEGESAPSDPVTVKVSGRGNVEGHVFEMDGTTGIAGATVTMQGVDEFGDPHTYNYTTDAQGYYTGAAYAGVYNGSAGCEGYQTILEPIQGNPVNITYNQLTTPVDYMLDENFDPVCGVIAEYYPDSLDPNSPYVKVYWGCGLPGSEIIEDFETGDFSQFDWQVDANYPWSITTTNPYEGAYCMKSGGAGVNDVTSNMTVTVEIPADGLMSFFGKISSESNYDYGHFYIDGVEKGNWSGAGNWTERSYEITAGTHTFQWRYTKDFIVNSNDDCFYVDYINFYKQPEPAVPGMTYDFENSTMQGWTSLDADGDGYGWYVASDIMSTGYGHNGSNDCVLSQSYNNSVGVLYPDNYLVSPQVALGGIVTFYACAQDANYAAEHFGVAVSTTSNSNPSSFTMLNEWTMSAKNAAPSTKKVSAIPSADVKGMGASRDGNSRAQGNWYQYTVDLSAYAGQTGYVAIRHFNCSDMFYLDVDDITISEPGKGATRAFSHYRVYRTDCYNDGPYTLLDEEHGYFGNTRVLACEVLDTVYIDTYWNDPTITPAGVYKWGVGVVYEGNRGEEIAGPIHWAQPANVTRDVTADNNPNAVAGEDTGYRAPWDLMNSFNCTSGYQYGVATDGNYIYTSSWSTSSSSQFYKYDLDGNFVEEFNVSGSGQIRDLTYDGQYFYGVANSSTIYCLDLANHSLVNTITSAYGTMRCCGYDPVRDGFWVVGNWSGNLTLINRQGAIVTTGPAPSSASGVAYYKDENNVEHVFCFCNSDNLVYDYDIASNTIVGTVFNFSNTPGYTSGSTGGCHVGEYNGTMAFFGDLQQDPNVIGIYELRDGSGPVPPTPGTEGLQEPRESEIVWSNCLDKDMYLNQGDVTINVLLNSADNPEGTTIDFVNYNAGEQELYPMDQLVLDETGYYAFDSFRRGIYQLTIRHDGYETIIDSVNIWEPIDMRYVMIEIIYGVSDLYVSSTGWAMWGDMGTPGGQGGGGGQGSAFSYDLEAGLPAGWNVIDGNNDGNTWCLTSNIPSTWTYYASIALDWYRSGSNAICSGSYINGVGALNPDEYLVTEQVTLVNGSTFSFWAAATDANYAADHFGVFVSDNGTSDWTMVNEWTLTAKGGAKAGDPRASRDGNGNRLGNWYQYTVDLSAFAGQKYIAIRHFNCYDQYIMCVDDIELTTGAKNAEEERHLESFKVMCTSLDGEPIFNTNVPADQPFCQLNTDELVPGDHYICKVAAMYSTGMSDWTVCEWQYIPCTEYAGTVNGVTIEGNEISWEYPGGGGGGQGGQGSAFSYDLEAGLPAGWNVIDANNDGNTWCLTSNIPSTWTYYAGMSLDWYRSGSNAICSGSYINGVGAVNPDEYLVTEQVTLVNGSTFSFWAAATDENYAADHFGVFVSDNGTSDWTMVNEWTLTAKGGAKAGDPRASRDGNGNRLGSWHQYTVDLSAFAGQKYIAIRHFNCYDQYIMCVDDIELTAGAKANRNPWDLMMTFTAPEGGHYGVAYDGNNFYTSNWGYSSAAYNFYKYDLQGNMLEGFNIAGCGTLRGITYDGTYFYGVANSSTVYCVDLANHSVVSTFTTSYGAMRGITYDPARDGFWVIGNWSGNLTLIDRTGAVQQTGPAPESASDLAYYKDENDVEHIFCFNNGTNEVNDWVIGNPAIGGSVFNFSNVPGFDGGTSGGCTVGSFNGKIAFIGDIQQSPNLIGVYELRDDNTPVPTPTGDVLGAMIFADGEWEAFVEYPTNTYTYEGEAEEVCVRMVYNGTNNLPEGNIYFSMSCPECEPYMPGQIVCEPGAPIHSETLDANHIKVWWGDEPAAPVEDWLYYDDGTNEDAIGLQGGGSFYWAIKFPAASLANYGGCSVTKVAYFDYTAHSGVVRIYQGSNGNGPSTNMIGSYNYTANGTEDWVEWNITPASFDNTQDLWIVMNNTDGGYVAAVGPYTGDPNGTMLSLDGAEWYTLDEATGGSISGTWNLRCFVSNQAKGGAEAVEMPLPRLNGGELAHAGMAKGGSFNLNRNRAQIVSYNVYRATEAAGDYVLIGTVTEETAPNYYEYIDSPTVAGTYYYQVTAVYDNDCESEPALAADGSGNNYVSGTTTAEGVDENGGMAIFPNPTKANVTIQAKGMQHITVVSVLGQVVYDADVDTDEVILNMAQYSAGMYTVRVMTENGVRVERVSVVR